MDKDQALCECQSLVKVSECVTYQKLNNTVIKINDTNYTLQGVANFSGVENITITGRGRSLTHINCNSTNPSGAGIVFEHSSNIILNKFAIVNCGIFIKQYRYYIGNLSGILLLMCRHGITASGLAVSRSHGQGIALINTYGVVTINDSVFEYNSMTSLPGGGGLHVIMLQHYHHLNMRVSDCNFTSNSASAGIDTHYLGRPPQFGRGGGISIQLFHKSYSNLVILHNVRALNNSAIFGGGLYVYCGSHSRNNSIIVYYSKFITNKALLAGGGANVGFTTDESKRHPPHYNQIEFKGTIFDGNTGLYGGGLSIFIASVLNFLSMYNNVIEIQDCVFSDNTATGGTAVDISPDTLKSFGKQFIGIVRVQSSKFINNKVESKLKYKHNDEVNNGAFYISKIPVTFRGVFLFAGNTNSALYITSALVYFTNSQLVFVNNSGDCGGAIHFGGSSKMIVGNNTAFSFTNNTASQGGAVCAILEELHGFIYTESCFILFEKYKNGNVTFHFSKNSASSSIGTDIFVSSLQPCIGYCEFNEIVNVTVTDLFTNSCIGHYSFDNKPLNNTKKHIATYPSRINAINYVSGPLQIFPGIPFSLEFKLLDEVGNNVGKLFPPIIKLLPAGSPMSVKKGHEVATDNEVLILGKPNTKGKLVLQSPGIKKSFNIELMQCPSGYYATASTDDSLIQCTCGQDRYNDIYCTSSFKLELTIGYWAGYIGNASEHTFFTGTCALPLCTSSNIQTENIHNGRILLPKSSSELEQHVCASGRTGILCAHCKENNSVYYHSINFTCGNTTSCQYGILIYIASELVPVTIIFLIILLFNISLTSGAVYSFVFYAQTISAFSITAFGVVNWENKYFQTSMQILQIIYGVFNMDILNQESLSFCIVPTNSIMTLYMFKFATVFYAFFLVLATILVLRLHSCYSCVKLCRRCGRRNIRGSIVDGLSAFLVLCYFQCAQISYHILMPSKLIGIDKLKLRTVPLLDGELDYLKGAHLWYAVPAILCMIFILIPPPIILILEPILTKLFSMDRFFNTLPKWYYNRLRLKLMPFLDSFQACFKNRDRCFAGFYFVYRLIGPMTGLYSAEVSVAYTALCVALLLIITCHVIVRPYKTKWHSIIDFLILLNLFINALFTLMNYNATLHEGNHEWIKNRSIVQVVLLCFPIGYLVCYVGATIVSRFVLQRGRYSSRQSEITESTQIQNEFPARLLSMQDSSNTFNTF